MNGRKEEIDRNQREIGRQIHSPIAVSSISIEAPSTTASEGVCKGDVSSSNERRNDRNTRV